MIRFGSVCSGIEAASVAWIPLGWECAWLSEIEPFPCAVLKYHFPDVPNYGDMCELPSRILAGEIEAPDILCGGTPCQAFSNAGLKLSLEDERGNLSLKFCELADAIDTVRERNNQPPGIVFWENVPGVLKTKDNAFGWFLGGLAGSNVPFKVPSKWSYAGLVANGKRKVAWRLLDAQFFGVPQRRKRIFVIASARKDFDPSKILFEYSCVQGDPRKSPEKGKEVAAFAETGFASFNQSKQAGTLIASGGSNGGGSETLIRCYRIGSMVSFAMLSDNPTAGIYETEVAPTLMSAAPNPNNASQGGLAVCMSDNNKQNNIAVRRLTPRECERLQGFPDDYTLIPWKGKPKEKCPDQPRYKAIGNSWAVPVIHWLGNRIEQHLNGEL